MKKYKVLITARMVEEYEVFAKNESDARKNYNEGEFIGSDFVDVSDIKIEVTE